MKYVALALLLAACSKPEPKPEPPREPERKPELISPALANELITNNCLACHAVELLQQQRLTLPQWTKVLEKMQKWGAPLEPEHLAPFAAYLAANYGTTTPPFVAPSIVPSHVDRALDSHDDGPFARGVAATGRALYEQSCATCHGEKGQGAALGTTLTDRPILHRAADFTRVIVTGRGRMPAFSTLTEPQLGALLAYARTLRL